MLRTVTAANPPGITGAEVAVWLVIALALLLAGCAALVRMDRTYSDDCGCRRCVNAARDAQKDKP